MASVVGVSVRHTRGHTRSGLLDLQRGESLKILLSPTPVSALQQWRSAAIHHSSTFNASANRRNSG